MQHHNKEHYAGLLTKATIYVLYIKVSLSNTNVTFNVEKQLQEIIALISQPEMY